MNDPYVKLAQRRATARAPPTSSRRSTRRCLLKPGSGGGGPGLRRPAPGASTCGASSRPRRQRARGAAVGELNGTIIALDLLGSSRSRACTSSRATFARTPCCISWRPCWPAVRSTWWCPTWRPTCRASKSRRGAHRAPGRTGARVCAEPPQTAGRAGVQGLPRQRLQPAGEAVQGQLPVVKPIKPKASRDKSAETFLVGIGLKRCQGWESVVKALDAPAATAARSRFGAKRPAGDLTRLESPHLPWQSGRRRLLPASSALTARSWARGRSRGEQSMVLESRCLAGDRTRAVHRVQAVRPRGDDSRQPDRLLRFPRGGAQQAHQERAAAGRRRRHRDPRHHQRRQANCAPPRPTWTVAWSAT